MHLISRAAFLGPLYYILCASRFGEPRHLDLFFFQNQVCIICLMRMWMRVYVRADLFAAMRCT